MKVVLDTNVVVSGLLSPFGPPAEIIRMTAGGLLELCYDSRILFEYESVLLREKFPFDRADVGCLLEQIQASGALITAGPLADRLPHPDDEPFLEAAIAGNAEYLVTGNIKHYPVEKRQGARIVSPANFLEIYRKTVR